MKYIFALFLFASIDTAYAQDNIAQQRLISEMNRIKPLQNPRYEKAAAISGRNILDSTNKVVGKVEDILLDVGNGEVTSILGKLKRLHLSQSVYLNYRALDISSLSTGYSIGFRKDEIVDIYPTLLANIETAAGNSDIISLNTLLDRRVMTSEDKFLGRVEDVLFNDQGTQALGLYISVTSGTLRNEGIMIPFTAATFLEKLSGSEAHIDQSLADYMIKYIKEQ